MLKEYTKGSAPKDPKDLDKYCNREMNKRLQMFDSTSTGSLDLKRKNRNDLEYRLTTVYKNYLALNERKAVLYEKIMDVYDEAIEVCCV